MIKLLLSIFFVSFFLLFSCKESKVVPSKVKEIIVSDIQPDQISRKVEVHFVDSSFTKAILNADTAKIYQKRQETYLIGSVKVRFFDEKQAGDTSVLTSDSAKIDDVTNNMLARGNVFVVSDSKQMTLRTSVLQWDNLRRKLFSTEFVKIVSPKETIEGFGFESDQTLNNYKIFRVKGVSR